MIIIKMNYVNNCGLSITDLIWNSSNFVLDIKENKDSIMLLSNKNEFSDKMPRPSKALVDIKQYKRLLDIKEKIQNCSHWDKWSKLVNPYDKVPYLAKHKNTKDYYKFFEIFKYFNIVRDFPETCISAHMGESSLNSAKALAYFLPKVDWYANVEIKTNTINPLTHANKSQTELNKLLESDMGKVTDDNGYSRVIYQDPNDKNDKNAFRETIKKADIIIGDCTIDASHDPNNQEQLAFNMLFDQVLAGLHMQLRNGYMIIKIFDSITRPTCQLIYYLSNFYEKVSIIKPRTSRYTNSEKFIVARKFKGILNEELKALDKIMTNWNPEHYFRILGIDIPEEIEAQFLAYNKIIIENQYNYIEKTIKCNYNEEEIPDKQLEAFQNKNALLFCSNFGIPVNLSDSDISVCKHIKKKKIQIGSLKNTMVCEKCFSILLVKN
jgi:23S rRNA U2552 (ribose-2'-O)-methylase RlmE/FtsJ